MQTITFKPLDPGIVLEKLVVDYGGYKKSYLFMNESKVREKVDKKLNPINAKMS